MNTAFFLSLLSLIVGVRMFTLHNPFHNYRRRSIQPRRCVDSSTNRTGVCMFAWNCLNSNGTHLTHCVESFYIGSCCALQEDAPSPLLIIEDNGNNGIDDTKISNERPYEILVDHTKDSIKLTTLSLAPQNSTSVPSTESSLWKPTKFPPGLSTWRPNEVTTKQSIGHPFLTLNYDNTSVSNETITSVVSNYTITENVLSTSNLFVTSSVDQSFSSTTKSQNTLSTVSSTLNSTEASTTEELTLSPNEISVTSLPSLNSSYSSSLRPLITITEEDKLLTTVQGSSFSTAETFLSAHTQESTNLPNITKEDVSTDPSLLTTNEQSTTLSTSTKTVTKPEEASTENSTYSFITTDNIITKNSSFAEVDNDLSNTELSTLPYTSTMLDAGNINVTTSHTQTTRTHLTESDLNIVTSTTEFNINITSQYQQNLTDNTTLSTTQTTTEQGDFRSVCGRPRPTNTPQGRIVGGGPSQFCEWPWVISLRQWKKNTFLHKCGAALLNEFWAITAAHCVENVPTTDILLRLGEYDLSSEDEVYPYVERRIQLIASHPKFDRRTFEYDLALLRFYEPVTFKRNILPVCIPTGNSSYIGEFATVAGWGRLHEDGPLPDIMQEVEVPIVGNNECEAMYKKAGFVEDIPDIFLCAGLEKGGKDSCEGDSGGPLVIQEDDGRWVLVGIISWGIGCAIANQPGVYTRITKFSDWINQIIIF